MKFSLVCLIVLAGSQVSGSPFLEFAIEPSSLFVSLNESIQLDCSVSLVGANQHHPHRHHYGSQKHKMVDIRWKKDGEDLEVGKQGDRRAQLSNGSLLINSATKGDSGLYQCVARYKPSSSEDHQNSHAPIISRYARISILDEELQITRQPHDLKGSVGDVVMFPCHLNDVRKSQTIKWFHDDMEVAAGGASNPQESVESGDMEGPRWFLHQNGVLEIAGILASHAGRYKCSVDGRIHSRSAQLTVSQERGVPERPYFTYVPEDLTVNKGESFTLNCAVRGIDRNGHLPEIVWLKDGIAVDLRLEENVDRVYLAGEQSLYLDFAQEEDSGLYTCRAINAEDHADVHFVVNVKVQARIFEFHRDSHIILEESSDLELPCVAEGNLRPSVTWFKNDQLLTGNEFAVIDPDDDTLIILGLTQADQGNYQCLALNDLGSSRSSTRVEVIKRATQKISIDDVNVDFPINVSASDVGSRSLTLSWKPLRSTASPTIGYTVIWVDQSTSRERRVNVTDGDLEAVISHLRPGINYNFKVVAFNDQGRRGESSEVIVKTKDEAPPPSMPTEVQCTPLSSFSINLSWMSDDEDHPPTSYKIHSREMHDVFSSLYQTSASTFYLPNDYELDPIGGFFDDLHPSASEVDTVETKFTFTRLSPNVEYSFRVSARNSNGASPSTKGVTCRTFSDAPSQAPQNVTLDVMSSTSLLLKWSPPSAECENGIITGYKIRWKKQELERGNEVLIVDGATESYEFNDLTKGTQYSMRIQALTMNGTGPSSPWTTAETFSQELDESVVPGKPVSLKVRPTSSSIGVNWSPPLNSSIIVRGYILGYGQGVPDVYKVVIDARQKYYNIKDLKPKTEYVITLRAFNNLGDGEPNIEQVVTKDESTMAQPTPAPLTPPVGLKASSVSPTSVRLSWTDPNHDPRTNDDDDNFITNNRKNKNNNFYSNYRLGNGNYNNHANGGNRKSYYYVVKVIPKTGTSGKKPRIINSSETSLLIKDLNPDTQYEFSVKVVTMKRESAWSLSAFNRTKESGPSSAPRDLAVSLVDNKNGLVELTWLPPKRANGVIIGFLIYHTGDASLPDKEWSVESAPGDASSLILRDLPGRKTQYFKMQARNSIGYSPLSATVAFKMPAIESGVDKMEMSKSRASNTEPTNLPGAVFYAVIGSLAALFIISSILIGSLVCYKRKLAKEAECRNGTFRHPTLPHKELKPPDLWNHEQVDIRSQGNHRSSGNYSPTNQNIQTHHVITTASSVVSNDESISIDIPEDDRYLRPTLNFMYSMEHGSNRDALSPLLSSNSVAGQASTSSASYRGNYCHGNAQQQGSALDGMGCNTSGLLGGLQARPFYQLTPYTPCTMGMSITTDTSTPRVNAGDVAPPPTEQSLTTLERQKQKMEKKLCISGDQRSTIWPAQLQNRLASLAVQSCSPPSSSSSASVNKPNNTSEATTSPIATSVAAQPTTTISDTGSHRSLKGLTPCKSISAEELTAEMANLEGLMKDLTAITQKDFHC